MDTEDLVDKALHAKIDPKQFAIDDGTTKTPAATP